MADIQSHRTYSAEYSGLLSSLWITLGVGGVCILGFEILSRIPRRRGKLGPRFYHGKRTWLRGLFSPRGNWRRGRRNPRNYRKIWSRISMDHEAHELQPRSQGESKSLPPLPPLKVSGERMDDSPVVRAERARQALGSQEAWEFAYLYQPRAWNAVQPSDPLPKWPLLWIWKTISFPESKMPDRVGIDCTSHIRFLRGCIFYVVLHMCTTLVILLPLHLEYAPENLAKSSMLRAGISITGSEKEKKWLWVHVVLLYWLCLTWVLTLIWVIWGILMYRKRNVAEQKFQLQHVANKANRTSRLNVLKEKTESSSLRQTFTRVDITDAKPPVNLTRSDLVDSTLEETSASTSNPADNDQPTVSTESLGLDAPGYKRYRTLLVTNIPPVMRSEEALQQYFTENLSKAKPSNEWRDVIPEFVKRQLDRTQELVASPRTSFQGLPGSRNGSMLNGMTGISQAFALRNLAFYGETDVSIVEEVVLVRKLGELGALRQRRAEVIARLEAAHVRLAKRIIKDMMKHHKSIIGRNTDEVDTEKRDPEEILRMADRLKLYKTIKPFLPSEEREAAVDGSKETSPYATVWEALLSLPPEVLDPYQPLTRKLGTTNTVNAPLIDYLGSKLRIITEKMEKLKSQHIAEFTPASSAFVTFTSAKLARRALKELSSHPLYALGCRTQLAPDYSDLIWPRLNRSVFRADQVRSWVIAIALFFVTLLWIFPVSALCGLASITTISSVIPALADYLNRHPSAGNFFEDVVPIILVAGLTIAVCPLLLLVANKAETLVCGYQVHNSVLWRNWVFLWTNVVLFFSIGKAVIQSYIFSTYFSVGSVLNNVASAFPSAAPYYASYLLLQTVIQSFFELFRLGLPLLFYIFSTSRAITPRKRAQRLAHSTISWFFSIPNSLLALGVVNLFTIYNALVLPFAFVYYVFCFINYKRSILYVYGRRYENNGRRNSVRYLRYSLDCLLVTQFSMLAFMIILKQKALSALTGIMLPITVFVKLAGTRLVKYRFDRLSQIEADQIDAARKGKDRVRSQIIKSPEMLWFRILAWPWRMFDRYFTLPVVHKVATELPDVQWHQPALPPTASLEIPNAVVGPYSPQWDDIPSRDRMQSYKHQPWYYDSIQKWLWLPRDPLSTLDLEDTVEVSLCLVTSQAAADLRRLAPADVSTPDLQEKLTVKTPEQLPRLDSGQSRIGTAVDDEDDEEDDPHTNLIGRTSRRVVRLLSHRRRPDESSPSGVKRKFTRINSHRYRSTSTRRRSINIVSNEATMAAAAREELEESEKLRNLEAKQAEAEMRAQHMDPNHHLPWYKAPFRQG